MSEQELQSFLREQNKASLDHIADYIAQHEAVGEVKNEREV